MSAAILEMMGRRIRMLRAEKGWTMRELGKRVGVSAMAVCKWERGEAMSSSHLLSLCRELQCTVEFLLGDWRRDVDALSQCIDEGVRAGIISRSRAWELKRAFDLPGRTGNTP